MKVYIDRNNIYVELNRLRKKYRLRHWKISSWTTIYEIRLIAIREVSPPFDEERTSRVFEQDISFPANKQHRQLWNSESLSMDIMNVYIARNNMQVQFVRFRQKYRLYSDFCFESSNSMQYRSMLFNCIHVHLIFEARFKAISSTERIVQSFEHK